MDALLAGLFDVPVAVCTLRAGDAVDPLLPAERAVVTPSWSEKRRREYEAGRHCARRALSRLTPQLDDAALERGVPSDEERVPCFPSGVAGSITHTGRGESMFAAAAVSRSLRSLGIDAELHAPLSVDVRQRVLTENEERALARLGQSEDDVGRLALIAFSAKEAFYKCQYPLTRTFLEFREVELELDLARGSFELRLLSSAGPLARGSAHAGRFAAAGALVVSAVSMR